MIKILELRQEKIIVNFLSGQKYTEHLNGLQILCREVENGIKIGNSSVCRQFVLMHFFSPFPKVRRWAYYSSELLMMRDSLDPLKYSLLRESDEECRLWAWKAFTSLGNPLEINGLMNDPNFNYWETNLELISISAPDKSTSHGVNISWKEITDDPIASKWVGISFGYDNKLSEFNNNQSADRFLIKELQFHEDISVAEYAIWAFFNRSDGVSNELLIPVDAIGDKSPGIRAWAYRLLFKDNITSLKEEQSFQLIAEELKTQDMTAKRGLARSFRGFYWVGLENLLIPWVEGESDTATRSALIEHMILYHSKCSDYEQEIIRIYQESLEGAIDRLEIQLSIKRYLSTSSNNLAKKIMMFENTKNIRGDLVMGNKIDIGSIGDINAKVVNLGEMRDAVVDSLQHTDHRNILAPIKKEVEQFIDMLASDTDLEKEVKFEAIKSIEEVSASDSGSMKSTAEKAFSAIKKVESAANSSKAIVSSATKIIEILGGYLS